MVLVHINHEGLYKTPCFTTSVADPHHFDADPDPDPAFHFDADPDPTVN